MYFHPLHLKNELQLPLYPHLLLGQASEAICPGSWLCTPCTYGSPARASIDTVTLTVPQLDFSSHS